MMYGLPWQLAAAAKSLQSCPTPCDPIDAAHQAPLSLGFSRQEHWSGLPFPLQCMKVKTESEVAQECPTLCDLMDYSPPGSSIHGIFQARVLEWLATSFLPTSLAGKEFTCNEGDLGSIPGSGRSLEEDMAAFFSILVWRITMDREAWRATVHRVTKSWTRLSD